MVMVSLFQDVGDLLTEQTRTNMSAKVCKPTRVVKISTQYGVAMGLCRVGPCLSYLRFIIPSVQTNSDVNMALKEIIKYCLTFLCD